MKDRQYYRLRQLSLLLALVTGMVYHGNVSADPSRPSYPSDQKPECEPPGFWRNRKCWTILQGDEDCAVQPVVVELEDQPVYCPKNKILKIEKTDDSRAISSDRVNR